MLGTSVAHMLFKYEIARPTKNRINGNENPLSFHVYTLRELLLCILRILLPLSCNLIGQLEVTK